MVWLLSLDYASGEEWGILLEYVTYLYFLGNFNSYLRVWIGEQWLKRNFTILLLISKWPFISFLIAGVFSFHLLNWNRDTTVIAPIRE